MILCNGIWLSMGNPDIHEYPSLTDVGRARDNWCTVCVCGYKDLFFLIMLCADNGCLCGWVSLLLFLLCSRSLSVLFAHTSDDGLECFDT